MRRIVGLDLNGWRDAAARDWRPEEPGQWLDAPLEIDGGVESVAVEDMDGRWLGGPQAAAAPHGRGPGWGAIGAEERRLGLSKSLAAVAEGRAGDWPKAVSAASRALAFGAQEIICGVADRPETDEAARSALLTALALRNRRCRLLWRPVAAFLDALALGLIPRDSINGKWRIFVHAGDGIEVQTLRLRRDETHPAHVAPEREGYGRRVHMELGLECLRKRVARAVLKANPGFVDERVERSRLALALTCGEAVPLDAEVLRRDNADWTQLVAPDLDPEALIPRLTVPSLDEDPVQGVLLLTPLAGAWAETLAKRLSGPRGPEPTLAPWSGLARGSLIAGRLIERGLPHYFDRLEPIALAVLSKGAPRFRSLIPAHATVPANREFVSEPMTDFTWSRGKPQTEFYILKGASEVRHWVVDKTPPPARDVPVELRLRQTPGQSWAKLSVGSSSWEALRRAPITLDWAALTPSLLTPEEVLEKLRTPPPVVPERIVEPADLRFWIGGPWVALGIGERLTSPIGHDVRGLADSLRWSRRDGPGSVRFRPVGTEGALPEGLPAPMRRAFDSVLADAVEIMRLAAVNGGGAGDNHAMAVTTWVYGLCPVDLQEEMVRALEAKAAGTPRGHPFNRRPFNATMLTQGAGRATTDSLRLARLLRALVRLPLNNNSIAALALILTRRKEVSAALDRTLVEDCLRLLAKALQAEISKGRFKLVFSNTLSAIAGLFRWREKEPYALLADRDPLADEMRRNLRRSLENIASHSGSWTAPQSLLDRIESVIALFDGRGSSNVLHILELDDDDDDEGDPADDR